MSEEKLAQAVLKILRMTREGALEWEPGTPPPLWTSATDSVFPLYFETEYQGRRLALFQERFRIPELARKFSLASLGDDRNWGVRARLALLGPHGEILFNFPELGEIRGLLDAVLYKAARVDDFLDELLKTE